MKKGEQAEGEEKTGGKEGGRGKGTEWRQRKKDGGVEEVESNGTGRNARKEREEEEEDRVMEWWSLAAEEDRGEEEGEGEKGERR